MTTIIDVPMRQADGDPGDEASPRETSQGPDNSPAHVTVPIPAGDTNEEVQVLHSRVCAVHKGFPCNCGIEWHKTHVIDKRRTYDAVLTPFSHEPIGDQLVIKRLPEEEGLIIESDNAKEAPLRCEVIAVSKHPSFNYAAVALAALHPGDHILIRRFAGTDVKVDNMEYVIINVFDVLLKFAERG